MLTYGVEKVILVIGKSNIMDFPFVEEKIDENTFIRVFSELTDSHELVWHRDREDRIIQSIEPSNWKFQFDNQLPIDLNRTIFIPKETYHRLIKGSGELKILIKKLNN
jgi:hypothetical protein